MNLLALDLGTRTGWALSEILKNGIRVIVRGTADKTHTIGADSEPVL